MVLWVFLVIFSWHFDFLGSWLFLVVLVVLDGSWWFLVVLGFSWWFFLVHDCSCWFLVVFGGS